MKKYLEVGRIVGVHGLKGAMRVQPWCDTPDFLCDFKYLYGNGGSQKYTVISSYVHKRVVVLSVEGVDTVEKAELLRGKILYIDRDDADIGDDAYFIQDLFGLNVIDAVTGRQYGVVSDVFQTGANDVYQVTSENKKQYLIPAIDDVVKEIDIDNKRILICPLKGIFDDED